MADSEDLITWTEDEVVLRTRDLLGEGQILECKPGEDSWEIRILEEKTTEDDEGEEVVEESVIWSDFDFTRRGAYFKAYHFLWKPKRGPDDPWSLSPQRPTLRAVANKLTEKFADPEDLDPEAVASVYSKVNPQTKRK